MKRLLPLAFLITTTFLLSAGPANEVKHIVKKGETVYSISRHYGVKVSELIKANPRFASDVRLKPGQQIYLPTNHTSTRPAKDESLLSTQPAINKHKIASVPSTPDVNYREEDNRNRSESEVLNSVARNGGNSTAYAYQKLPQLSENDELKTPVDANDYASLFNKYQSSGYSIRKTKGAATYLADNTSGNQYLALYNGAESGSVIEVTNLMNQKTLYVKVIGRVPPIEATKGMILTLSNTAAAKLGATDSKILVEVQGVASH